MEQETRRAYDAVRKFDGKAFRAGCYAPFVSLYFTTLGNVLACCKNETFVLGNVGNQRLKDIWSGGKITQLRKTLSHYQYEAGCEFCDWQISEGDYQGAFPWLFEEFPVDSMQPEWPSMIEFAGSNTCNFECLMCNGELSSSIRAHRDGLPPLRQYYDKQFFEDVREFIPHLRMAKFLGGEPFLAAECHRIWDMMIEQNCRIPCHVTTNGSQYNAKVERILEKLPLSFTVSIDGATKQTYEKIRVNSNYEENVANVRRFREYARRSNAFFSIAFCLMRQNWHEFVDLLLFAESLDCPVFVNTVIGPPSCSLYTLKQEDLRRIADEIENKGRSVESLLKLNQAVWLENVNKLRGKSKQGQAGQVGKILETFWDKQDQFTVAKKLAREKHFEEALEIVSKIDNKDPSYYRALALSGNLRRILGDIDGAEQDLIRALKITKKRAEAFLYLAWLRFDQNRLEESLQNALHARSFIKPEDFLEAELCKLLGSIYGLQGRLEDALQVLNRLLVLRPRSAEVHALRSAAFKNAGMREEAISEIEKALVIDPNNSEANVLREN
jgi:MoaA/NifB/PqqE/SkfB family radical SAM enzyme/Flp pilus assembly protein TadD